MVIQDRLAQPQCVTVGKVQSVSGLRASADWFFAVLKFCRPGWCSGLGTLQGFVLRLPLPLTL